MKVIRNGSQKIPTTTKRKRGKEKEREVKKRLKKW